ncbi:MAG TPA: mechanosensitive ion channel domain-containing protein, partial [Myxococcota bacterium]|nr:mechanosensitive ion channel domain-containing protein [Myxococcota bacterium]
APAPDLKARLAAAQSELDRFVAEGSSKAPPGTPPEEIIERRSLLEMMARSLERQIDARDDLAIAQRDRALLSAKAKAWPGPGPGPHSLSLADGLRESAQTNAQRVKAAEAKVALFEGEIETFKRRLRDAEAKARLADERAGTTTTDAAEAARRAWARDLAVLRVRALGVVLAGLDTRLEVAREELGEHRDALDFAQREVTETSKSVAFTRADIDRVHARIDREKAALESELADAQATASTRRDALARAQADLAGARQAPLRPGESPEAAARRRVGLERAVTLARVQAENADLAYDVLHALVDSVASDRAIWDYRYQLANEKDGAKLRETYDRVDAMLALMAPWRQFAQREVALARTNVRELEARVTDAVSADERSTARALLAAYRDRVAIYDRALRAIERQQGSLERWKDEFHEGRHVRPALAYASDAYYGARNIVRNVWDFELFSAEDTVEVDGRKITTTRSVTVGKSVGAVVVLALGYLVTSWLVRRLERQLVTRFKADPNVARIARRWLQVMLVGVLFVLALDLVKIPLTVFAFLGGALAIAFGFGAQNLLKNLMSGIMLLVERPLKIGDIVQIGETLGTVTNISIRSSTIRTADGIETLVPNSALVEHNVTNWTHSSSEVRRTVKVGVAYGSDTRKVSDTLLAQAERHGQVLKSPSPRVIFEDFADNALAFSLEYWIDYGKGADGRQIASDLRFMIEKALGEAGIAVPYPQRDVHLDAAGPLKVEVVSRAEPQALRRDARG